MRWFKLGGVTLFHHLVRDGSLSAESYVVRGFGNDELEPCSGVRCSGFLAASTLAWIRGWWLMCSTCGILEGTFKRCTEAIVEDPSTFLLSVHGI